MSESDDEIQRRRSALFGVKLRALVAAHTGDDVTAPVAGLAGGAWVMHGNHLWALFDGGAGQRWGAALALAVRDGAESLQLILDEPAAVAARRSAEFAYPIAVWAAAPGDERRLRAADPAPPASVPDPPATHVEFAAVISAAGARVHVESGVVMGEVCGLEVCRVVGDTEAPRLEIGVGANDREAFAALHGTDDMERSLARVVEAVAHHRRPGADHHPLNRLAPERGLRWRLEEQPSLVGAVRLEPAEPPVPRPSLVEVAPCVAEGVDAGGTPVAVVCSSGVDLDLVPYAADARRAATERWGDDASVATRRLVIAVPARDRLPIVERMVELLGQPAGWSVPELVSVP